MLEALFTEPHRHGERACAMVAEHNDGLIRIEFLVRTRRDFSHGHEDGIGKAGGCKLPRFADIEQERCRELLAPLGEGLDADFRGKHKKRI